MWPKELLELVESRMEKYDENIILQAIIIISLNYKEMIISRELCKLL